MRFGLHNIKKKYINYVCQWIEEFKLEDKEKRAVFRRNRGLLTQSHFFLPIFPMYFLEKPRRLN